jgi:hypothetical protein
MESTIEHMGGEWVSEMTLEQLKKEMPPSITIQVAAPIMEVSQQFLRFALRDGRFPFGIGQMMDKQYEYYINTKRFIAYMEALDMGGQAI